MPVLPFCAFTLIANKPKSKQYTSTLTLLGDHLRNRRLDLGLEQKELAKILGVCLASISHWENGHGEPQLNLQGKVIEFLGYNPFGSDNSISGKIKLYRVLNRYTQDQLARKLRIDNNIVRDWEKGAKTPTEYYLKKLSWFFLKLEEIK